MTNNSKFQRRHYEAIAETLAELPVRMRWEAGHKLADLFQRDNPRFRREQFERAAQMVKPIHLVEATDVNPHLRAKP